LGPWRVGVMRRRPPPGPPPLVGTCFVAQGLWPKLPGGCVLSNLSLSSLRHLLHIFPIDFSVGQVVRYPCCGIFPTFCIDLESAEFPLFGFHYGGEGFELPLYFSNWPAAGVPFGSVNPTATTVHYFSGR